MRFTLPICLFSLFTLVSVELSAQVKKDSVEKKSLTRRAFKEGMKLISTNPNDTIANEESINPYEAYAGRIIRNINIEHIGFEKSIYDSAKKVDKTVTKISNFLHVNTREKTVRKHLFFYRNHPLNPYKVADNERYLRDRDFILDSRIVVVPVDGTDSVDITVVTRDVFSLGGSAGGTFPTSPEFTIYDANVDGRGQRVEFEGIIDQDRSPKFGYALRYRKSSILGSLANLELGYTELDDGYSFGDEHEFAYMVRLSRPLVSPYSRLAGGVEVSRNWSQNVYLEPDSTFYKYNYKVVDTWIGYNIGINKAISNRNRKFLAFRYVDGYYVDQPDQQEAQDERKYNNIYGYLGEFTFYRQNFYKTRYVYGFGRTEDIPYGYTLGFSSGYIRQLGIERPYAAVKFNYGAARSKGDYLKIGVQIGGYYRNSNMEDLIIQNSVGYVTKLIPLKRYKWRNHFVVTYTQLTNHTTTDWLNISKKEIPGFKPDSIYADKRVAFHAESVLYTPWSLLGFRFAPFLAVDVSKINCFECPGDKDIFFGFSSGFRTRNENLIFGTMEVKFTYIPYDQYGSSKFVFGFKQNLQIKNTGSFVKAPSFIVYN